MRTRRTHARWLGAVSVVAALAAGTAAHAQARATTPVPSFRGPIAVTPTSVPYLAANRLIEPIDLAALGYVEEEYLVSGNANVYDWAASGDLTVKVPQVPYVTRILVRRPAAAARFSGNAIVEVMHSPFGQDFGVVWGWSYQGLVERGDAWIGVTSFPSAAVALKKFDPARYASISWASPQPVEQCAAPPPGIPGRPLVAFNNSPAMEEGLRWDMISQVGALLKSAAPNRPLAGLALRHVFMTAQDTIILTYINAIHRHATLASGQPVYDGYMVKGYVRPARIRRCAPELAAGDPRIIIRNVGVPVIHLQMEGDFPASAESRRADSDEPTDRFRLYEIPGTAHFDSEPYRKGFPQLKDMSNAGYDLTFRTFPPDLLGHTFLRPFPEPGMAKCVPEVTQEQPILGYVIQNAFALLEDWVDRGIAPPRADRLRMEGAGAQARVATDAHGNGVGGYRTPYVDVPFATYHMHHDGGAPLCRQFGWEERFDWPTLQAAYGSFTAYAAKVEAAVTQAVTDRRLTPSMAARVKQDMLGIAPAPAHPFEARSAGAGSPSR